MMEKLIKKLNNRKGFTLIELIVVIAIIGILAAILIPQFSGFTKKANASEALVKAKSVATAIDSYFAEGNASAATNATSVAALAGVSSSGIGTIDTDGGFAVTVTVNGVGYSAGRDNTGAAVKVIE